MEKIGITERGDAALHWAEWVQWVQDGKPAILITKDPSTLYNVLLDLVGYETQALAKQRIIVHCTITDLPKEYEPRVPTFSDQLDGYYALIEHLGGERVVLRVDPVIPTEIGIAWAAAPLERVHGRIRMSFLDAYPHVRARLARAGVDVSYDMHAPIKQRREALAYLQSLTDQQIEVCGEPGLISVPCVGSRDAKLLGVKPEGRKGQRGACLCLENKHELLSHRGQCDHGCLYCYWK